MRSNNIRTLWKNFVDKYKIYFKTNEEIWLDNLKQHEDYIIQNNKLPENLNWLCLQKYTYKRQKNIMKNEKIRKYWESFLEKYILYFSPIHEKKWLNNFKNLEEYIIQNNKRPSENDKNVDIKQLSKWICTQNSTYFKYENIMKNEKFRIIWGSFIEKYKKYFLSYEDMWFNNLKQLEEYMINNNKKPLRSDKDVKVVQLSNWLRLNKKKYEQNNQVFMENEIIKKSWETFIEKYNDLILSNSEIWNCNLKKLENYTIQYNKKQISLDNNIEIKQLKQWEYGQRKSYKNNKGIMKKKHIKKNWEDFIEKYKKNKE